MPAILDYGLDYHVSSNFTAVAGGRYAIRTTEASGLTMTLPANPVTGATVEVTYAYGTGTFRIATGGGGNLYTGGNPYSTDYAGVSGIDFDGDYWQGHTFICVYDGANWTINLGLTQPQSIKLRDYIQLLDAEIYCDAVNSNAGVETKPLYWRSSDGRNIGDLRGIRAGYNAGYVEGKVRFNLGVGGWGYQQALEFQTASPPRTYCNGEMSANAVTNRSDARLKDSEEPLDPAWIDALLALPVRTYMMGDPDLPPSEEHPEGRKNPGRRRHLGFYAQDLVALAPAAQAEAAVFANQDGILEYDLGSMLTLTIKALQQLNARAEDAEAEARGLQARLNALTKRVAKLEGHDPS